MLTNPDIWHNFTNLKSDLQVDDRIRVKFKILLDGYRKMLDQSLSKSKDLGDMLRLLPGVVVQKPISIEVMVDLYRIEPDLLDRLVKSPIEALKKDASTKKYTLDKYMFGFLQD